MNRAVRHGMFACGWPRVVHNGKDAITYNGLWFSCRHL